MLLKTYPGKKMVKVCHGGTHRKPEKIITYQRKDTILVVTTPAGQQFVFPFEDTFYAMQLLKNMSTKENYE